MRYIPDTLAGRTIAVLLFGLGFFHLGSIWVYRVGLESGIGSIQDRQFAERLVSIARAVGEAPEADRDRTAHSLSSPSLEIHWSGTSLVEPGAPEDEAVRLMRHRLHGVFPDFDDRRLRLRYQHPNLLASVQLDDGSWVDLTTSGGDAGGTAEHGVVFSTTAMAIGIVLISIVLVRSFTAPLRRLSQAADRIGRDMGSPAMEEKGPREVRDAARAFNEMQARIRRLVEDRTQTLAAVSHDLKTPITRLRLRAEFVDDEDVRTRMMRDLDEMEVMIDQTLSFLRGDGRDEECKPVDVTALLEAIASDLADAGRPIAFTPSQRVILRSRPLAMKRAIINLIENALKYGGAARVDLDDDPTAATITIDDDGPGIPASEREAVFDPFYRLEDSRNRETGGTGLGLTIARTVIRTLGGDVTLRDGPGGGLRVVVVIPRAKSDSV
jgi:signal transduction histidine kinase